MSSIQLEIEGTGAIAATEALLRLDGLEGEYETVGEDTKEGTLAAIASIVGITVGVVDLSSRLLQWYAKHRQAENLISLLEKKKIPYNTKREINILDLPLIRNLRSILPLAMLFRTAPWCCCGRIRLPFSTATTRAAHHCTWPAPTDLSPQPGP